MKSLLLCVAAILGLAACANATGQSVITEDLKIQLARSSQTDLIPINIAMKNQIDKNYLAGLLVNIERKERRKIVARELKAFAAADQADVLSYLKNMEAKNEAARIRSLWINNVVCCDATSNVIEQAARFPGVRSIDWDEQMQLLPDDAPFSNAMGAGTAWGVSKIRAPEVWALGTTGKGILVSVHDTGIDYNHSDLWDHMWDGGPSYPNHGWDFYEDDNNPMDGHSHGTHCAGTIAGDGTAGYATGVAPDATLMALKVMSNLGTGEESDVWESIQFAMDHGVDVMSFSIGAMHANNPDRETWRIAFENTLAAGMIAAACAGNLRLDPYPAPDNVVTPGDVPPPWLHPDQTLTGGVSGIVTCGATDITDLYAMFSSYGPVTWDTIAPWFDYPYVPEMGLIDPDVAAPGVDIVSCKRMGGYLNMSGTSMATPHVAGAMCLLLEAHPLWTPAEIDEALEMTAVDLGPSGKDNDYGAGRIDALEAVVYGDVTDPIVYALGYLIDDSPPGNENGRLDPGETVDLAVTLKNVGISATNVNAVLKERDPFISVSDSVSDFGAIVQGDSSDNSSDPYVVAALPSAPIYYVASCTLHVTADGGYEVDRPFDLLIGDASAMPTGPDNYGYYCYDDTDIHYTECPDYDWLELAPPGPGTKIEEISDSPNDVTTRTLPFVFTYYGVDQTQISISTNGWICFGTIDDYCWLNLAIPDTGDPPAVVAPFWDDFDLEEIGPGNGDAYEYYDETNHRYILEWKDAAHSCIPSFWETFQIILYDPLYDTTVTGDGEIIFQYESIDFPDECTVGIEDLTETDGIQYLYNIWYDIHASPVQDGRAVKFTTDPPVGVEEIFRIGPAVTDSRLYQNAPNPFHRSTVIKYDIAATAHVSLRVCDVAGRTVSTLVHGKLPPGHYESSWNGISSCGSRVASGVYFCHLSVGGSETARKMVLIR